MAVRRSTRILLALAVLVALALVVYWVARFPPDTTPQGAYMRIAYAISRDDPASCFAYLEEEAQHSAFTIFDYAHKATQRVRETFPEPQRSRALARYDWLTKSARGPGTWTLLARRRGWITRLRRDMSGVARTQIVGERATVITAHGTRYAFRRRPNGIWGLTLFTAELETEAERLARDWEQIERAGADYHRAAREGDEGTGGGR